MTDPVIVQEDSAPIVLVTPVASTDPKFLRINEGTPGPRGPQGLQGPAGPGGGAGLDIADVSYVHAQGVAQDTWTISHPLAYQPNLIVVDSAGTEQVGAVRYVAQNTIIVTFSGAFSGTAYLS